LKCLWLLLSCEHRPNRVSAIATLCRKRLQKAGHPCHAGFGKTGRHADTPVPPRLEMEKGHSSVNISGEDAMRKERIHYSSEEKVAILKRHLHRAQDHDPADSAVHSTGGVAVGIFVRVMVITTTLSRTNRVPRIVRGPIASPPRKYPTSTATTGFTYA
jgi:hypothetical protein